MTTSPAPAALRPLVAEVKGNSLDDGPGIRSVVFFKGCPLSCSWCHNPETKRFGVELSFDAGTCVGAHDCMGVCELHALDPKLAGFVDRTRCDLCGRCTEVCPSGALSFVGREWSVGELVDEIVKFEPFYRSSGGGITLSGGEATLYPEFCGELLSEVRARGIGTLLETCGHFALKRYEQHMAPWLDRVYFDLKIMDPDGHREHCGTDNRVIHENFRALLAASQAGGPELLPRVPLVPGITATRENLEAIASFLRDSGARRISLLGYNPLWHEKAEKVGAGASPSLRDWMDREQEDRCREVFFDFELVDS